MTPYSPEALRQLLADTGLSAAQAAELACVSKRMIELAVQLPEPRTRLGAAAWELLQIKTRRSARAGLPAALVD